MKNSTIVIDPHLGTVRRVSSAQEAGTVTPNGYRRIRIGNGCMIYAHRLVYIHFHGPIPPWLQVDHINGNKLDNRISNLRLVTCSGNHENLKRAKSHSRSGLLGSFFDASRKKYASRIVVNGVRYSLGRFDTSEEAHSAYVQAKRRLHKHCVI